MIDHINPTLVPAIVGDTERSLDLGCGLCGFAVSDLSIRTVARLAVDILRTGEEQMTA